MSFLTQAFDAISSFFISLFENIKVIIPPLLEGSLTTIELFVLTLAISIPLALPFTLGSISKFSPLSFICKAYIWVFRGTPLMLQLFFFYYGIPIILQNIGMSDQMLNNIRLEAFPTAVITFALNYSAYFAEIYRAGIESVDKGQHEAAKTLGLTPRQTLTGIVIPQAIRFALPPMSNEAITLIKDTALVYVIGVAEILKNAKQIVNREVDTTAYVFAAVFYLVFTFVLTWFARKLEKKFSKHAER